MSIENLLQIRETLKRRRPKFVREEATRKRRLKKTWRKPRGLQNKTKISKEGHNKLVKVGYKSPVKIRHLTKEGQPIIRISNTKELEQQKQGSVIIINKTSKKNKIEIIKKAIEKKITIINAKEPQKYIDQVQKELKERKDAKKQLEKKKEEKTKQKTEEKKEDKKTEAQAEKQTTEENKEQEKKELDKILTKKE